ncbi:Receptor-like serine/threonine-protein kinase ALE2 [Morella rubra]|uniref:Receptor-like serine/threonine-protein kinase ALE2 n=1 Tax=Morella rubra TaxID=262757 RepID=A0A6A1WPU0_9ROSI|nr:Receptor-like serine/threonine-protein kinase ALE2 [Morella rubra]
MKSAYYSNQDARFQPPDGSPIIAWQKIWKAKSQSRLKLLLWKFASRALTTDTSPVLEILKPCLVLVLFGLVYSGVLEDGTKVLAVKVLKRVDQQGGLEFLLAEVEMISRGLHHPNLVKLIGMRISAYVLRSALLHLVYELIPTSGTFSASDIEKVTDNFYASRVLGEGGFGLVYSGVLGDGTKVAIKSFELELISGVVGSS